MPEPDSCRASPAAQQRQPRAPHGDRQDAGVPPGRRGRQVPDARRARGSWCLAHWDVPGGGLTAVLTSSLSGTTRPVVLARGSRDPRLHSRYRWSARRSLGSVLAGRPLPRPQHAPVDDPLPIARWLRDVLRTADSRSSPVLERRREAVPGRLRRGRRDHRGAVHPGRRSRSPGRGWTSSAERRRRRPDLCHQRGRSDGRRMPWSAGSRRGPSRERSLRAPAAGLARRPSEPSAGRSLISSIRPSTAFILLNVAMGDQAVVSERACGCPYQELGWTTHSTTSGASRS